MEKKFFRNYVYPVATLTGSIIGVGFFALPYITLKIGILPMLFLFFIFSAIMVYLNVVLGKISLKTPDHKRFPGFVGFWLGKWPKTATLFLTVFSSVGVLLVYIVVGSQFLSGLMSPFLGGTALDYVILYFIIVSSVIFFDIKMISKIELWSLLLLSATLFIIFLKGFAKIKLGNIFTPQLIPAGAFQIKNLLLAYGAIIFSLGTGFIPETEEMLKGSKKLIKRVVIISTLIPAAIYLIFIFLILGITGSHTSESALAGLKGFLGNDVIYSALFISSVIILVSFITQGLLLKETLMYDMNVKKNTAWAFTCFAPLALYLWGFNSFVSLVSFIGGVFSALSIILTLLMYKKIGGSNFAVYSLIIIFLIGMILSVIY